MHSVVHIRIDHGIVKISHAESATTTATADFSATILFRDDRDRQTDQRSNVGGQSAIGTRHHDHIVFTGQTRHDLHHTGVFGTRQLLDLFQQLHFVRAVEGADGIQRGIQRLAWAMARTVCAASIKEASEMSSE
jgi:hypothetical protein